MCYIMKFWWIMVYHDLELLNVWSGLPSVAGWTACCSEAGEVYYHHAARCLSQWSHPGHPGHPARGRERVQPLAVNMLKRSKDGEKTGESEEKGRTMHSIYDARSRHVP